MDEEVSNDPQQLLERARQRRLKVSKMLNDDAASDVQRKRRTPLSEDLTTNLPTPVPNDESPKRQCVRGSENDIIKPDTPAISSVRSRMNSLIERRAAWSSEAPPSDLKPPRKCEDTPPCGKPTNHNGPAVSASCKKRFAGLAQQINNWEDESDIHPTMPEAEKSTTPRKHTVKPLVDYSPVNSPGLNESPVDPTPTYFVTEKSMKIDSTQKSDSAMRVDLTVSHLASKSDGAMKTRLNSWEQKIEQEQRKVPPVMKAFGARENEGGKQPTSQKTSDTNFNSVAQVRDKWQKKDESNTPKKEDEPTAYSVSARMSAWEKMTSDNQIGQIKRVDPNVTKPSPVKPKLAPLTTTTKATTPARPASVHERIVADNVSVTEKTLTPSKSMVNCMAPSSPVSPSVTNSKYSTLSPTKASCAMKAIQQRLVEQTQTGKSVDIAQRLRDERMAELKQLQNRWKNGVLKDPSDELPSEQTKASGESATPTTAEMASKFEQREAARAKARNDFDSKLETIGLPSSPSVPSYTPPPPPPPPLPPSATRPKAPQEKVRSTSSDMETPSKIMNKPPMPPSATKPDHQKDALKSLYALVKKSDEFSDRESISSSTTGPSAMTFDDSFNSDLDSEPNQSPHGVKFREPIESFADSVFSDEPSYVDQSHIQPPTHPASAVPYLDDDDDDDDISMAAFIPESLRRESCHFVNPRRPAETQQPVMQPAESISSLTSLTSTESEISRDDPNHDVDYTSDDFGSGESDAMPDRQDLDVTPKPAPRKREGVTAETTVKMPGQESPLVYSISMYRSKRYKEKRAAPKMTVVTTRVESTDIDTSVCVPNSPPRADRQADLDKRIEELQTQIYQEQAIITQASNALNQCFAPNSNFVGSSTQVECNRVLLVATQKRNVYVSEIQRLRSERTIEPRISGPRGSLTISDIRLPLKKEFVSKIGSSNDTSAHYFMLLIKHRARVILTEMLSTHDPKFRGSLDFSNLIKINNIPGNFQLNLDIYSMALPLDHQSKDKKKARTPKKSSKSVSTIALQSPGGPNAVRTTEFTHITSVNLHMGVVDRTNFQLANVPYKCPLYGSVYMRLTSVVETNVEEKGFLTMFEDVSGLGAWHRRWCVLTANKMCFWRYPDDVSRKDPICYIDLKRCTTEKVGLIPRDVCARPNTFELVTVHQPRKGEYDTLVSKTGSHGTQIRHMMSSDTKEERLVWCNQINKALLNLRTWNSDALKPSRKAPAPRAADRLV